MYSTFVGYVWFVIAFLVSLGVGPGFLFWVVTWVNWYIGISLWSLCFLYLFFAVVYCFWFCFMYGLS